VDKLREYIEQTRKSGYSDKKIVETLQKAGWSQEDINRAVLDKDHTSKESKPSVKTNTLAIIALIASLVIPLAGLILGIIALKEIKRKGEKGFSIALAAIIISLAVVTLLSLLVFFIILKRDLGVVA